MTVSLIVGGNLSTWRKPLVSSTFVWHWKTLSVFNGIEYTLTRVKPINFVITGTISQMKIQLPFYHNH